MVHVHVWMVRNKIEHNDILHKSTHMYMYCTCNKLSKIKNTSETMYWWYNAHKMICQMIITVICFIFANKNFREDEN